MLFEAEVDFPAALFFIVPAFESAFTFLSAAAFCAFVGFFLITRAARFATFATLGPTKAPATAPPTAQPVYFHPIAANNSG